MLYESKCNIFLSISKSFTQKNNETKKKKKKMSSPGEADKVIRWSKFSHTQNSREFHGLSREEALAYATAEMRSVDPNFGKHALKQISDNNNQQQQSQLTLELIGKETQVAFETVVKLDNGKNSEGAGVCCCVEIIETTPNTYTVISHKASVSGAVPYSLTLTYDRGGLLFWSWDKWTAHRTPQFLTGAHLEVLSKERGAKRLS